MNSVTLAKPLDRAIRDGAPWIFRDALQRPPRLPDGGLVEVLARDGRLLATGYWDSRSPIAVRILEPGPLTRADFDHRLRGALARRLAAIDLRRTNALRWVHGEADRLPGLHLDMYATVAVFRCDGAGARAFYRGIEKRLARCAKPLLIDGVVDRESGETWGKVPGTLVVRENSLLFEVSPGRASKGGLFLDQRDNRAKVESLARNASVLNLFGYTGGFSLYAARGGAASTDTVDISKPALAAAKRNFERNRLPLERAKFHARDAFEFLEEEAAAGRTWDVVISDPPSFAPSKASLPKARAAYDRLHRLALAVTAPGGTLCAASCSSHYRREDLLASLESAARAAGRRFRLLELRGAAWDHPVIAGFPEGDYLKFALGTV